MTTAVDEIKDVVLCFKELCDAYLVKPIDLSKLVGHLRAYRLVP
jgi:DNA-binding response OmpR family regulator